MLTFLIMAGGSGERFWPLSTKEKPKQLLNIFSDKPLIQKTYERLLPLVDNKQIFIATNEIQVHSLKEILPKLIDENIIIEPIFKDTASAICYGSMIISKYYDDPTIVVLASDHLIEDEDEFRKVLLIANEEAQNNKIVTLGIQPTYPETGYGYIEVKNCELNIPTESLAFKEKPSLDLATIYFNSKKYLWNSGMFIFKYNVILEALKIHSKNHYDITLEISKLIQKNEGLKTVEEVKFYFEKYEKKSIDFAVMEKAQNIVVIPSEFGWNDVGSYAAFDDMFEHDNENNVVVNTSLINVESKNNVIINQNSNKRVSLLGIENLVIVQTENEILICNKDNVQDIKKIINKL